MVKIAGYFRGRPADAASLAWLSVYEAELLRRGLLKKNLDIFQIIGRAAQSAGTHGEGGAIDDAQTSAEQIRVARNMGCAKSHRYVSQGFTVAHGHGVLKGAPAAALAKSQVRSLDAGRNGLASNGADIGPRKGVKWPLRSWKAGIKWAAAQVLADSNRHQPVAYVVTTDGLAGRQYPAVGPVKIRRKKGFKIRGYATYTDPAGRKHVRTRRGTWYALAYLRPVKAATPPTAPPKAARWMKLLNLNCALNNGRGLTTWPARRKRIRDKILAAKPDVFFAQELPRTPGRWLDTRIGMPKRVGSHGRYIFLTAAWRVIAWSSFRPESTPRGVAGRVTFARARKDGRVALFANCHSPSGNGPKWTELREAWADEVLDEIEARTARSSVPRSQVVIGGDFNGPEFAARAKERGFASALAIADKADGRGLRTYNSWSKTPTAGGQHDYVIVDADSDVPAAANRWNASLADHNRLIVIINRPN